MNEVSHASALKGPSELRTDLLVTVLAFWSCVSMHVFEMCGSVMVDLVIHHCCISPHLQRLLTLAVEMLLGGGL